MKKHIALLLMLLAAFSLAAGGQQEAADDGSVLIGVSKLLSHAALDAVEEGMQDYLASTGMNVRYDFQNANGDISTAASIAQQFDSENCDVVLGIGTASAQAMYLRIFPFSSPLSPTPLMPVLWPPMREAPTRTSAEFPT